MSRYYPKKPRSSGPKLQVDPATKLHDQTVKLFDKGDGHGADWAAAAEASFRCAFAFLRHVPADDPRGATIARRVLDAAMSLVAGSEDSGMPYTAEGAKQRKPGVTMHEPEPGHRPKRP